MKLPIYQIDAFSDKPFRGNPAAVCPLDDWLPTETLQAIAEENNLAETAFLVEEGGAYRLRWFTPTKEVDLCGHATLAAAHVLFEGECRERTEITFESKSGILRVLREQDYLTLDFPIQLGTRCDPPEALIKGLGVEPRECYRAEDYLAEFDTLSDVVALSPDFRVLADLALARSHCHGPWRIRRFCQSLFRPEIR